MGLLNQAHSILVLLVALEHDELRQVHLLLLVLLTHERLHSELVDTGRGAIDASSLVGMHGCRHI